MRSAIAIICLAPLVADCGATTYTDITHSGRGLDQLRMDGAGCDMALQQSGVGQSVEAGPNAGSALSNVGTAIIAQDNFLESCMLSRGWERK
jgi:hypothetical protein